MSATQPVAILRALFWMVCSGLMFESFAMVDHVVDEYSRMGRVIAL